MRCARCTGKGAASRGLGLRFCWPCATLLMAFPGAKLPSALHHLEDPYWKAPVDRTDLRASLHKSTGWPNIESAANA